MTESKEERKKRGKCIHCNKEFIIKNPQRNRIRKYCSLKCVFNYRRKLSKDIKITRQLVIERANGRCEECNNLCKKFHVHHKTNAVYYKTGHSPKSGEQNNPRNLIALCIHCHRKRHSKGIQRFKDTGKCIACGREFKYYSKSNRGKYCSRKCAYNNSNLKLIPKKSVCINCGLVYMTLALKPSKFCSNKCKSKWHYDNKRTKD